MGQTGPLNTPRNSRLRSTRPEYVLFNSRGAGGGYSYRRCTALHQVLYMTVVDERSCLTPVLFVLESRQVVLPY
jgi:hypothetical protein